VNTWVAPSSNTKVAAVNASGMSAALTRSPLAGAGTSSGLVIELPFSLERRRLR
jgi:hypothetical protein